MSAWDEGRPVFKRLPQYGWQDNLLADQIVAAYDTAFMQIKDAIANFPRDFIDPETARVDALDWLAQLMGFTEEYWDSSWDAAIKRELIANAQRIWQYKGSFWLLQYLIDLFELSARIKLQGAWLIGTSEVGDPIGSDLLIYSILIGDDTEPKYVRTSYEWRLMERLNRLYMPCWCQAHTRNGNFLHYHRFRVQMSMVGDPI